MRQFMRFAAIAVAAVALLGGSAAAQQWGTLSGTFVIEGKVPAMAKVVPNKDLGVCGKVPHLREDIVVGKDGGLANVLVYALGDPKDPNKPVANIHPGYAKLKSTPAVLDNKDCRFEPRLLTTWTAQKFALKNSDPAIAHNSFGSPFNNKAFNPLIPAGATVEVPLDKPEKAPFPVTCSIHPWMKAYAISRPDPYAAVSKPTGELKIENLPAGEHTFQLWHETLGYLRKVSINGKESNDLGPRNRGQHKITIKAGDNSLGKVVVKAADYDAQIRKIPK